MKEFFKPNAWKITVAILIFVVLSIFPIIPCYTGGTTGEPGVPKYTGTWKVCSINPITIKAGNYYDYFGLEKSKILGYVYLIIIAYLISCTIIYAVVYLYSKKQTT